jgi:hypothetical protein
MIEIVTDSGRMCQERCTYVGTEPGATQTERKVRKKERKKKGETDRKKKEGEKE